MPGCQFSVPGAAVGTAMETDPFLAARLGEPTGPRLRTPRRIVDAGREASEKGLCAGSVLLQTEGSPQCRSLISLRRCGRFLPNQLLRLPCYAARVAVAHLLCYSQQVGAR